MTVLEKIMAERKADAVEARKRCSAEKLRSLIGEHRRYSLRERLEASGGPKVIAEVKKASPSAGLLYAEYKPELIAVEYEKAGAAGISVLTEPRHFSGSGEHLCSVRESVRCPVLRKDFICDPYQLIEAAVLGADVVLLIVAGLEKAELRSLYSEALDLGLEVLIESHTPGELKSALELEQALIGVNSRNLKTHRTDTGVALGMADLIPADRLSVAESGIAGRDDVMRLRDAGYRGFLVGESLLRAANPGKALALMINGLNKKGTK